MAFVIIAAGIPWAFFLVKIMKAYAVVRTFKDGSKEGVVFTDEQDALSALNGTDSGSMLAVEFTDIYGGEPLQMVEVEI